MRAVDDSILLGGGRSKHAYVIYGRAAPVNDGDFALDERGKANQKGTIRGYAATAHSAQRELICAVFTPGPCTSLMCFDLNGTPVRRQGVLAQL
jgi:hypothetical protein